MLVLTTLILAPLAVFLAAGLVTSIRRRGWKAGVRQFGVASAGLGSGVAQAVGRNAVAAPVSPQAQNGVEPLASGVSSGELLAVLLESAAAEGGGSDDFSAFGTPSEDIAMSPGSYYGENDYAHYATKE
ncbi:MULTISPECIES: hypothetical protein [unclassified Thioalkalivibrio]|uniref:hypothetical protein n=1 Tax=unclassified Thioalkalivibrio TaxID=2621013 RepID=UPI0009DA699B|nr:MULTISPECIES: hypothetical protein [unclassified Thioalkalivibrio]